MDVVEYEAFVLVLTGSLVLLAWPLAAARRVLPLMAFIAIAVVQTLAAILPLTLGWRVGHWNWTGKLASLITSLVAMRVLALTRDEVGLVWPRGRFGWVGSAAGLVGALVCVVGFVWLNGPHARPSVETVTFQATMPGFDEELAFRGLGMALLWRGFPSLRFGLPIWTLPVAITSVQFTMVHVVNLEHGHFGWAPGAAGFVLPIGLLLALIRVGTGSLLGGVVTHNAVNVLGFVAALFILILPDPQTSSQFLQGSVHGA